MITGGYILQPRIIQESDIMTSPPYVREIWAYLLREANSSDVNFRGKIIKRGQLFRSYDDIKDALSWYIGWRKMSYNENHMKKAMKFLRDTLRIESKKEPGGVLITVCKYDYYQNPKNYERTTERTTESTIEEPLLNQSAPTINKNEKNDKNDKKERSSVFAPPIFEDVKTFFVQKGYSESYAIEFFEYYTVANWFDARGNKVKNWKQKAISVWLKEDKKKRTTQPLGAR